MEHFKICCFVTKDTPYEEVAKEFLVPSLEALSLDYDLVTVPHLGNWNKNTAYKPTFAKEMLNKHDKDIVLLDADARVMQYPSLFNKLCQNVCIGAHILDNNTWYKNGSNVKELLTGTLFLKNIAKTKYLVNRWIKECQSSGEWEQKVLARVLKEEQEKVYELPLEYCYINTLPNGNAPHIKCKKPVIVHYQASRTLKRQINATPV